MASSTSVTAISALLRCWRLIFTSRVLTMVSAVSPMLWAVAEQEDHHREHVGVAGELGIEMVLPQGVLQLLEHVVRQGQILLQVLRDTPWRAASSGSMA